MSQHFKPFDGGFRLAPGTYAAIAQDWSGSAPDPTPGAGSHDETWLPDVQEAAVVQASILSGSVEALVLPVGLDRAGCPGRAIALGDQCLVAFQRIAIVPMEHARRRYYPYASHLEHVATLHVAEEGVVRIAEDGYDLEGFGRGVHSIDADTPGAFEIEGETFDMAQEGVAREFGYGTPAFNASLDEHGFHCDLKALRGRLRGRRDADAVALLNRLPCMDSAIAYWAPVQP